MRGGVAVFAQWIRRNRLGWNGACRIGAGGIGAAAMVVLLPCWRRRVEVRLQVRDCHDRIYRRWTAAPFRIAVRPVAERDVTRRSWDGSRHVLEPSAVCIKRDLFRRPVEAILMVALVWMERKLVQIKGRRASSVKTGLLRSGRLENEINGRRGGVQFAREEFEIDLFGVVEVLAILSVSLGVKLHCELYTPKKKLRRSQGYQTT